MGSDRWRSYLGIGAAVLGPVAGAVVGGVPGALIGGAAGTGVGVAIGRNRQDRAKAAIAGAAATGASALGSFVLTRAAGTSWDTSVIGSVGALLKPVETTSGIMRGAGASSTGTSLGGGATKVGNQILPRDTGAGAQSPDILQKILGSVTGALGGTGTQTGIIGAQGSILGIPYQVGGPGIATPAAEASSGMGGISGTTLLIAGALGIALLTRKG